MSSSSSPEGLRPSEHQALAALERIGDAFFVLDKKWRFTYLNDSCTSLFGSPCGELLQKNIWKEFPDGMNTPFYDACREAMRTGIASTAELHHGPTQRLLLASVSPVEDGLAVLISDQTERLYKLENIRASEALYRFITENSADLITLCDSEGTYLYASAATKTLLGYPPREIVGSSLHDFIHPEDKDSVRQILAPRPDPSNTSITTYRLRRQDGTYVWVETTSRTYSFEKTGSAKEIVSVSRDITERKQVEDAMFRIAFHDPLTGLPNRKLMQDRLDMSLRHARRTGELVAVLFLDLDRFKMVNDTMGHQAGDELLKGTATRLLSGLREEDTVARFGGDEFVMLLPGIKSQEDAVQVAENILQNMQPHFLIGKKEVHVNASIGIALYPTDGTAARTLLQNADNALYEAKEAGRNSYKVYSPTMQLKATAKMFLEDGLRRTIDRDELTLYYQPIWDLRENRMVAAEALLRWNHPGKGLVMPSEFIPLAEEAGIITSIGEWIVTTLAAQLKEWEKAGIELPVMSINISPRQFASDRFMDSLLGCFTDAGMDSDCLQLELTERVAMENVDESIPRLRRLKDKGFRIAIDDFGSGYSSLSYLRELPLDVLKIDRTFATEANASLREKTIVQAIVTLGHTLNLAVCGEGIETKEQYDFYGILNCDMVQGFYIARPQATDNFTRILSGKTKLLEDEDSAPKVP